jgi:hypothetical protein
MDIVDPRVDPALVPRDSVAAIYAEHQDEYQNLPSVRTPNGYVITRWSPTDAERAAIVRGEDIFITLLSFGPITPMIVTIGPIDWHINPFDNGRTE